MTSFRYVTSLKGVGNVKNLKLLFPLTIVATGCSNSCVTSLKGVVNVKNLVATGSSNSTVTEGLGLAVWD